MLSLFARRRPVAEIRELLDYARAAGANSVRVDDVMLGWDPFEVRPPMISGVPGQGGNVVALGQRTKTTAARSGRGMTEQVAMEKVGQLRADQERELAERGHPEFRNEADIIAAEEAAERGEQPVPEQHRDDPAVRGIE